MAVEWLQVDQEVLDIAKQVIEDHMPELQDASIGFLFRETGPVSNGRVTMGMAKKVDAQYQALGLDYDFIIWLAQDIYYSLNELQRTALIHHELCHCSFDDDDKPKMVKHDFEEFDVIIRLYGFWRPNGARTIEAVQAALPMMELGQLRVEAIDPSRMKVTLEQRSN